ncbi:MAG: hypothetical protein R3E96_00210 [Planctomycetota bacterium]
MPLLDAFMQVLQPGPRQRLGLKAQMGGARAWAAWWAYEDVEFRTQPEFHGGERWSSVPEPGVDLRWEARAVAVHPHKDEVAVVSRHRAVIGSHGKEGRLVLRSLPEGTALRTIDLKQSLLRGLVTGRRDPGRGQPSRHDHAHRRAAWNGAARVPGPRQLRLLAGLVPRWPAAASVSGDHSARIWDARPGSGAAGRP